MLAPERDVNSPLQVKTASTHNSLAFGRDLQNNDHVKLFDSLPGIRRKLPSIRRILLSLAIDHVKLSPELPCLDTNLSNFG